MNGFTSTGSVSPKAMMIALDPSPLERDMAIAIVIVCSQLAERLNARRHRP